MLVFTVRPRVLRLLPRELIKSTSRTLKKESSSQLMLPQQGQARQASSTTRTPKKRRNMLNLNVAFVSGILVVASYVSITNQGKNYLSDTGGAAVGAASNLRNGVSGTLGAFFSTSSQEGSSQSSEKSGVFKLSDEEISARLRRMEESYTVNRGKGVVRYDVSQLPSNNPIEDDRAERMVEVRYRDTESPSDKSKAIADPGAGEVPADWMLWGVFDGHSGWNTSATLRDRLLDFVVEELSNVFRLGDRGPAARTVPSSDAIDRAIKAGFTKLDDQIVKKSVEKLFSGTPKVSAPELLMPALTGSCALVAFYDTHLRELRVALTGDSRAVLGSLGADDKWTATALTVDQTGSNPSEAARLAAEHPGEPNVVRNGRILGSLEPSRAFGDARYKWAKDIQDRVCRQFLGRTPPPALKTPPYVTAEPVVTSARIRPGKKDFLVLASDGLYELLSNEEIVGLVVRWMEKTGMVPPPSKSLKEKLLGGRGQSSTLTPVIDTSDASTKSSQRPPIRRSSQTATGSRPTYLLEDSNVATHLIRNALSDGGSPENVSMLLGIPSPLSRRYRDDLTVTVVFFGERDEEGSDTALSVQLTPDATLGLQPKPKL
ncbi:hypothetical protein LJB42_001081 [Komagataella kurtzmanii]|nr:hypothetical protein LJB42_001081 [Komagataella kurtzmanii]